jgi:UV DNA damage repair endonuclease
MPEVFTCSICNGVVEESQQYLQEEKRTTSITQYPGYVGTSPAIRSETVSVKIYRTHAQCIMTREDEKRLSDIARRNLSWWRIALDYVRAL